MIIYDWISEGNINYIIDIRMSRGNMACRSVPGAWPAFAHIEGFYFFYKS